MDCVGSVTDRPDGRRQFRIRRGRDRAIGLDETGAASTGDGIVIVAVLAEVHVVVHLHGRVVPPQRPLHDVHHVGDVVERALWRYDTAMKVDDYVHFCQDRNYHDAIACAGRPGFVEAYCAIPAASYPELASTVGAIRD